MARQSCFTTPAAAPRRRRSAPWTSSVPTTPTSARSRDARSSRTALRTSFCVNTTPGSQNNEDRCHGLIATATAAGAKATELELSPTSFGNPSAVSQAIKSELLKNPSVDGIFTISAPDADSAAAGIADAGDTSKVKLGNAGVGTNALLRIKAGTQAFLVDIEPYLQGYLAVSAAYQYAAYGLVYTDPTPTGPVTITKSNVDAALAASRLGLR